MSYCQNTKKWWEHNEVSSNPYSTPTVQHIIPRIAKNMIMWKLNSLCLATRLFYFSQYWIVWTSQEWHLTNICIEASLNMFLFQWLFQTFSINTCHFHSPRNPLLPLGITTPIGRSEDRDAPYTMRLIINGWIDNLTVPSPHLPYLRLLYFCVFLIYV